MTSDEAGASGRLDDRRAVDGALREVLLALPNGDVRDAWLVDIDFGDWPLGDAELLGAMTRWLQRPGRRLHLLGLQFDDVVRRQPRFALWRRDWAHAVEVRRPTDLEAGDMPCLLLAGTQRVELLDRVRYRGLRSSDAASAVLATHRIDAISQRSEPAWPVNTLGL